jgi:uncharacterized protein YndB with AHSA1/START domain
MRGAPRETKRNVGEWKTVTEAEVEASPELVWQAIATGPGLDGWFVGSNEVQPGAGGTLRSTTGGVADELSVTAWDPPRRVTYRSSEGDGGRFYALEWLVEGRAGATVLRCVASGFIPGDDWEAEYDSLRDGGAMYFYSLVQYLTYFGGRTALVVDAFGPPVADWEPGWRVLTAGLGLNGTVNIGDQVRLAPAGLAPIEGVVYAVAPHLLAVRTSDALYRFVKAGPVVMLGHRIFAADADPKRTEQAWQAWLSQLYA